MTECVQCYTETRGWVRRLGVCVQCHTGLGERGQDWECVECYTQRLGKWGTGLESVSAPGV